MSTIRNTQNYVYLTMAQLLAYHRGTEELVYPRPSVARGVESGERGAIEEQAGRVGVGHGGLNEVCETSTSSTCCVTTSRARRG